MRRKPAGRSSGGWFSVRCVFAHRRAGQTTTYEERITLWRATSAEAAIRLAEREAQAYARSLTWGRTQTCRYLGFSESYDTSLTRVDEGAEVFSLMRDSRLGGESYLDRYFDSGHERRSPIRARARRKSR